MRWLIREMILSGGAECLTSGELLAILAGLRAGPSVRGHHLLNYLGGLDGIAFHTVQTFVEADVPEGAAIRLAAAAELGRRLYQPRPGPRLRSAEDVYDLLVPRLGRLPIEQLLVLSVDADRRLIAMDVAAIGEQSQVPVDPAAIISIAAVRGAEDFFLVHNHPSGCAFPSQADFEVTDRVEWATVLYDFALIDHVIIARDGYYSMAESTWTDDLPEAA